MTSEDEPSQHIRFEGRFRHPLVGVSGVRRGVSYRGFKPLPLIFPWCKL